MQWQPLYVNIQIWNDWKLPRICSWYLMKQEYVLCSSQISDFYMPTILCPDWTWMKPRISLRLKCNTIILGLFIYNIYIFKTCKVNLQFYQVNPLQSNLHSNRDKLTYQLNEIYLYLPILLIIMGVLWNIIIPIYKSNFVILLWTLCRF